MQCDHNALLAQRVKGERGETQGYPGLMDQKEIMASKACQGHLDCRVKTETLVLQD